MSIQSLKNFLIPNEVKLIIKAFQLKLMIIIAECLVLKYSYPEFKYLTRGHYKKIVHYSKENDAALFYFVPTLFETG